MCPYLSRCIFTVLSLKLNMGLLQYYLSGKLNDITLNASRRQFSVCAQLGYFSQCYHISNAFSHLNAGSNLAVC